ncbi:hypothetical protein BGZ58_007674 [Dissophora ornata]|nr:hypothetical protein BGZ58_007674 [Dissophora ornata]
MLPLPRRPPFTHFLAIPLYTPHSASRLNNSLALFAAEVTATTTINVAPDAPGNSLVSAIGSLSMAERGAFEAAAAPDKDSKGDGSSRRTPEPRTNIIKAPLPRDSLRPPSSLHLTLGMMSLTDSGQLENAASFLRSLDLNALLKEAAAISSNGDSLPSYEGGGECPPPSLWMPTLSIPTLSIPSVGRLALAEKGAIQSNNTMTTTKDKAVNANQPLIVTLQGLVPMESLDASTVLYAAPHDPTGRLQPFCEALVAAFVQAELVIPEDRALKLHATIVNTVYVRNTAIAGGRGRGYDRAGYSESQRELVQRWRDEVWAEVELQKLVICEMGAKPDKDGLLRYKEIAQIDMPKYK